MRKEFIKLFIVVCSFIGYMYIFIKDCIRGHYIASLFPILMMIIIICVVMDMIENYK